MSDSARILAEVALDVPPAVADAAGQFLESMGGSPSVEILPVPDDGLPMPADLDPSLAPPEGLVRVASYFPEPLSSDELDRLHVRARAMLVHSFGLTGAECALRQRVLKDEDWLTAWRRHFVPIEVDDTLVVLPPWEEDAIRRERLRRTALVIDPGAAFGTGQHESTRLCLRALSAAIRERRPAAMLDVGCGSGVLAVAARLLGTPRAVGVDIDPLAVRESWRNAAGNALDPASVDFRPGSAADVEGRWPLVVANILLRPLIEMAPDLIARVEDGGLLVLAGIITPQKPDLLDAYCGRGMRLLTTWEEGDWSALTLTRP